MPDIYTAHRRDTGEPIDFPVEWSQPDDAQQVWRWDAEHNAFPITPLSAAFADRSPAGPGARGGTRPRSGINVHGYRYSSGGAGRRNRPATQDNDMDQLLAHIDDVWERGWRERIEREANEVANADYDSLSLTELVRRMEQCRDKIATHMDLMFRALDIISYARGRLTQFLGDTLAENVDVEASINLLIEGQWNASLEANAALWDVAQMAHSEPAVVDALTVGDPATLLERLAAIPSAGAFRAALQTWLDHYGRRSGDYAELIRPTWQEDATPVAMLLRGYLQRENPKAALPRAAARSQAAAEQIKSLLPDSDKVRFEELLAGVAWYLPVKESRNSVISLSRGSLRAPALAAGRKLVAMGAIQQVDEVFFLTFEEIEAVEAGRRQGLRELIAERRSEYEFWRDVVPPAAIGEPARGAEPDSAGSIRGVAASKGIAHGTARVILDLSDGELLQPGEILVTRSTTSAWTPLFLNAAGIVTDSGGILSHCAVVAREYELPAVVGTYKATRLIPDGAVIEVDGSNGLVRIAQLPA